MAIATSAACEAYKARFDNMDEVAHPAIFYLPEFGTLLQKAIARGSALTRAEVDAQFGPQAWDW